MKMESCNAGKSAYDCGSKHNSFRESAKMALVLGLSLSQLIFGGPAFASGELEDRVGENRQERTIEGIVGCKPYLKETRDQQHTEMFDIWNKVIEKYGPAVPREGTVNYGKDGYILITIKNDYYEALIEIRPNGVIRRSFKDLETGEETTELYRRAVRCGFDI